MSQGWRTLAIAIAATVVVAACDRSAPPTRAPEQDKKKGEPLKFVDPFPTPEEIEALAASPPGELPYVPEFVDANRWAVAEGAPSMIGTRPYEGTDRSSKLILDVAKKETPTLSATEGLHCVAKETGRFTIEHGGAPPPDVRDFIQTRCGVTDPFVPIIWWLNPKVKQSTLQGKDAREFVGKQLQGVPDNSRYGAWYGLGKKGAAFIVAFAREPDFVVEPVSMVASSTTVKFTGRSSVDIQAVQAWITRGELDAATCQAVATGRRKDDTIVFECPVDRAEAAANIEIWSTAAGAVFPRLVAKLFVSPDGSLPREYDAKLLAESIAAEAKGSGRIEAINALRKRLGRSPAVSSPEESKVASSLLPHIAHLRQERNVVKVLTALLAGWGVDGVISGAGFWGTPEPTHWTAQRSVAASMRSPYYRNIFLNEASAVLATATGALGESSKTNLAVDVAYQLFQPVEFTLEERAVLHALDQTRVARGLPPVLRVEGDNDRAVLNAAAGRIRSGETNTSDEMSAVAQHFADQTGRQFFVLTMTPLDIGGWVPPFSEDLVSEPNIAVAAKVTYIKPNKGPWGRWVVVLVYTVLAAPAQ